MNLTLSIIGLTLISFAISWVGTLLMKQVAPAIGFVDKPGGRKIHANPKPLGGGVAIFLGFALPVLLGLAIVHFTEPSRFAVTLTKGHAQQLGAYWSGIRDRTPVAMGILLAAFLLHLLGLADDRKALGPYFKLFVQISVITGLVLAVRELRAFTYVDIGGLGQWASVNPTILWIGVITNAFNFLDNMDGLSAGVAAVCT